ncbi:MAG: hypothetical protein HGA19_11950 [Oscillochloris sp.]|nr:hypothetical protein [Oscillochloris sp.]
MQSNRTPAAIFALRLTPVGGDSYTADAVLRLPQSAGTIDLIHSHSPSLHVDPEALLALHGDPDL